MVSGSTEFCTFSSCQEVVVPYSNKISWNTTSELINLKKIASRFLSGQLGGPCINVPLMW